MKRTSARHSITTKLMLMNMLILLVFGGISVIVFLSFGNVEKLISRTITSGMNRNVENAAVVRELSVIFADVSFVAGAFMKKEELLRSKGGQLVASTDALVAGSSDERLKKPLSEYSTGLRALFAQCERINSLARRLDEHGSSLYASLEALEKTISDKKIGLILKGYDATIMEQLGVLTTGYQGTLQDIGLLYARYIFEHSGSRDHQRVAPILAMLDDLNLRLQTLTASEADIARFGPRLSRGVVEYRRHMVLFLQAMQALKQEQQRVEAVKLRVLDEMKGLDESVSHSALDMDQHVRSIMESSRRLILVVSCAVVAVTAVLTIFFIFSTIRRPMSAISRGLNSIREGNLDTRISLGRRDEWGLIEDAINRMAEELRGSYAAVQQKNADLESAHGELRNNVAQLEQQVEARVVAERELARQHGLLEEMVMERTAELRSAQAELMKRERLSVLGQLTATVSHELRNPLGVIRSSAFYLQQKLGKGEEKVAKHLDRIEKHVGICDSIVADLLEFTRGRMSEVALGNLNSLVREVVDYLRPPFPVRVKVDLAPDIPTIWFDREKLRRVLVNLLENAVYAVETRLDKEKEKGAPYEPTVVVAIHPAGDVVILEISDNGTGMDAKTAAHAFEPLFTTKARGTGLGLAIVKKIIEEHGGSVDLTSGQGEGTMLTVTLPIEQHLPVAEPTVA